MMYPSVLEPDVRTLFVLLLFAACSTLAPSSATAQAEEGRGSPVSDRPNILVFVADDQGWQDAGPYGNDVIRTPTIDQLAETGLKVEKAFLTTPQCSPSRISILTGKYPYSAYFFPAR